MSHIHAPEIGLVHGLGTILPAEAGDADDLAVDEGAEHVRIGEALLEPGEGLFPLACESAGESFGMRFERFQPDRAVKSCAAGVRSLIMWSTISHDGPCGPNKNGPDIAGAVRISISLASR